jgi:glycosyltransferase involved in cell wall biosynthesis
VPATIRVLALSPIPEEGAGCRFRIAQYIPYLRSAGIDVTLRSLYTADFFHLVYKRGHYLQKISRFMNLSLKHLASLRDLRAFDAVWLYREMFPIGPAVVERLLTMPRCPPVVFDFDDAIFLPSVSDANQVIRALKLPTKVASIIRHSDMVIAGNEYLADYARRFNDAVTVIPTCVDTMKFVPADSSGRGGAEQSDNVPVIGWIGSPTTVTYLRSLLPALRDVRSRQAFTLRVSGAGEAIDGTGLDIEQPPWTINGEVSLFNTCDIGVYPLADDEWSKGKCGFKAIEFMSCGVPVVASAVGVNREIIADGVNGFLATTRDEWVQKLSRLLGDRELRRRFALAGRETVEQRYALRVQAPAVAALFREITAAA